MGYIYILPRGFTFKIKPLSSFRRREDGCMKILNRVYIRVNLYKIWRKCMHIM